MLPDTGMPAVAERPRVSSGVPVSIIARSVMCWLIGPLVPLHAIDENALRP
jgi:hypothetical protein